MVALQFGLTRPTFGERQELDLVRINPIGSHMGADPDTVISVIKQMKASGKGIVGMKILGQGDLRNRQSGAIKYALSLNSAGCVYYWRGEQERAGQPDPTSGNGVASSQSEIWIRGTYRLQCHHAAFLIADADDLVDLRQEYLAVTDFAGGSNF